MNEKTAGLLRGPVLAQTDLGNPLDPRGTAYSLCLHDDLGRLVAQIDVDRAGDTCGANAYWKRSAIRPRRARATSTRTQPRPRTALCR